MLCFSTLGRLYWLKVYKVPQGTRTSRGKPVVNLFPLEEGEKITAVLPIAAYVDNRYVFMATAKGTVKKTPLSAFSNPRERGIIAVELDEGDKLIGAKMFGQYKRLQNRFASVLTGKALSFGGSLIRTEATGYGATYFMQSMLGTRNDSIAGELANLHAP